LDNSTAVWPITSPELVVLPDARGLFYDYERIGAAALPPIPWLDQRLLRGRLIITSIVMYFITNLMKRLLSASFGIARALPGLSFWSSGASSGTCL